MNKDKDKLLLPSNNLQILQEHESNEIIFKKQKELSFKDHVRKKDFTYRVVDPKDFEDLIKPSETPLPSLNKSTVLNKRRGRPRKDNQLLNSKLKNKTVQQPSLPLQQKSIIVAHTRSGRASKLPSHIQGNFKVSANELKENELLRISQICENIKDKDYKYNKEIVNSEELIPNSDLQTKRERNIPSEYQCSVCNKIFLGRRMQKHYEAYPDHNVKRVDKNKLFTDMSLYKFLVEKIKLSDSKEQRVEIFLNEISDLVDQLQLRSSRFVQNTSGMHFVNSNSSKILGIPEGHYKIDVDEIDAPPDPIILQAEETNLIPPPHNLSISLDDTIADMISTYLF